MSIYLIAYIGHDASTVYIDRVQVPLSVNLLILGYVYIEDNGFGHITLEICPKPCI